MAVELQGDSYFSKTIGYVEWDICESKNYKNYKQDYFSLATS